MANPDYDVMVVGSGASGATAAKELTAQGLRVVMLEAGPEVGPKDFDSRRKAPTSDINLWERAKATVAGQGVQARAAFFNSRLKHLFVNDAKHPYTTPKDAPFVWIRGRQAGGRTHTFGRVLLRWTDDDFRIQSRSARGCDWPISYADIEPFYAEVERHMGLYGQGDGVPTLPDSIYSGEAMLSDAEQVFKTDVEKTWSERKVVSWRYIAPESNRMLRPMSDAMKSGRLDVRFDTIVRGIMVDPSTGRATGAELTDRVTGSHSRLSAKSVVLCASPIESIRLLLNSAGPQHPDGLGNRSGTLGRYFMDQLPCIAVGDFPKVKGWSSPNPAPPDAFYSGSGGIFIPRFIGADGETAGSDFDFQGSVGRVPVKDGAAAKMLFFGFGLMLPNSENRVTLDRHRKDAWGIPAPHIRCKMSDLDEQTLRRQVSALIETVEGVGGRFDYVGSPLGLIQKFRGAYPDASHLERLMFRRMFGRSMVMGAAIHESGGARMGTDPKSSVLNSFNQSWDVPNVFVTDASAFVGSGVTGTTLTIMALTVRACRHLATELRAGRL